MLPYEISALAQEDIKEIARYTMSRWGEEQSIRYAKSLEKCFCEITDKTVSSKNFSNNFPEILVTWCQKHYVFYIYPAGKLPLIIAVLHERMDMLARLKRRLG